MCSAAPPPTAAGTTTSAAAGAALCWLASQAGCEQAHSMQLCGTATAGRAYGRADRRVQVSQQPFCHARARASGSQLAVPQLAATRQTEPNSLSQPRDADITLPVRFCLHGGSTALLTLASAAGATRTPSICVRPPTHACLPAAGRPAWGCHCVAAVPHTATGWTAPCDLPCQQRMAGAEPRPHTGRCKNDRLHSDHMRLVALIPVLPCSQCQRQLRPVRLLLLCLWLHALHCQRCLS